MGKIHDAERRIAANRALLLNIRDAGTFVKSSPLKTFPAV